jgi:ribonuclease/clavin/mitogillin
VSKSGMSKIFDSVTAVLLCGPDVFIAKRQVHLLAFPGYWAFPGGKVDKADSDDVLTHPLLAGHPPRLLRALDRELREELGFDLLAAVAAGQVRALRPLGEVTTPAFMPVRFRTHFFEIELLEQPVLQVDAGETAEVAWHSPHALHEQLAAGRLLAAPPTRIVIQQLTSATARNGLPDFNFSLDEQRDIPWIEVVAGLRLIAVRSNTIPPADRTNAFWLGKGARRVLIDPSPNNREELARLQNLIEQFGLDEIFLTHHHPDHREFADDLARHFDVPIGMSADTQARIAQRSSKFFDGVETKLYGEGDVLTQWQGEDVRLYAVPGHDEGQLAPMPDSRTWCIVSDLIQGVGTVVVGGPEGNMRKYFASLQRVIDLDPQIIIPSHGPAFGSTYRIRETLQHRLQREEQVFALHQAGESPQQMLSEIYKGLDPRLAPLALINIQSHLKKLHEDGRIEPHSAANTI